MAAYGGAKYLRYEWEESVTVAQVFLMLTADSATGLKVTLKMED